jgi:hypothetical protein
MEVGQACLDAKAFSDRNGVVDVNHALRRLADAKARYGMSDKELEQYELTAPDQPGLFHAGFPFGAAFCPSRVEPWLKRRRRQHHFIAKASLPRPEPALSAGELESRGTAFLGSLGVVPPLPSSRSIYGRPPCLPSAPWNHAGAVAGSPNQPQSFNVSEKRARS